MKKSSTPSMFFPLSLSICLTLVGCGDGMIETAETAATEHSLGMEAFEGGDYETARQHLRAANEEGGGLISDNWEEVQIHLALVESHLGDHAAAHALLDELSQGAADMASVFAARAFVLLNEKKTPEAQEAFREARSYDPAIQPFKLGSS